MLETNRLIHGQLYSRWGGRCAGPPPPTKTEETPMSDTLLTLTDEIERTIERAQADHLNGFPEHARAGLSEAIRGIDKLIAHERRTRGGYDEG